MKEKEVIPVEVENKEDPWSSPPQNSNTSNNPKQPVADRRKENSPNPPTVEDETNKDQNEDPWIPSKEGRKKKEVEDQAWGTTNRNGSNSASEKAFGNGRGQPSNAWGNSDEAKRSN